MFQWCSVRILNNLFWNWSEEDLKRGSTGQLKFSQFWVLHFTNAICKHLCARLNFSHLEWRWLTDFLYSPSQSFDYVPTLTLPTSFRDIFRCHTQSTVIDGCLKCSAFPKWCLITDSTFNIQDWLITAKDQSNVCEFFVINEIWC